MSPLTNLIARFCAPTLNYHACFKQVPDDVAAVDSITPEVLHRQLESLKQYFSFVPVDELLQARSLSGVAAVTWDDGYKSVIDTALPVFEALDIPFTVFVNTRPLEGGLFWRHKVTAIMSMGLAAECEAFMRGVYKEPDQSFYGNLKHPRNSSKVMEEQIEEFLSSRGIRLSGHNHLFDSRAYFRAHRLIWYGNHSHSHFVLSSLSCEEQAEEIARTKAILDGLSDVQLSAVFALPFGQTRHANLDTFAAVSDNGYRGLLMNRGRVNRGAMPRRGDVAVLERFSPAQSVPIETQLVKEFLKTAARSPDRIT